MHRLKINQGRIVLLTSEIEQCSYAGEKRDQEKPVDERNGLHQKQGGLDSAVRPILPNASATMYEASVYSQVSKIKALCHLFF